MAASYIPYVIGLGGLGGEQDPSFRADVIRRAAEIRDEEYRAQVDAAAQVYIKEQREQKWFGRERTATELAEVFDPSEVVLCRQFLETMRRQGFPGTTQLREVEKAWRIKLGYDVGRSQLVPNGAGWEEAATHWKLPGYHIGYVWNEKVVPGTKDQRYSSVFLCTDGRLRTPGGHVRVDERLFTGIYEALPTGWAPSIGRYFEWNMPYTVKDWVDVSEKEYDRHLRRYGRGQVHYETEADGHPGDEYPRTVTHKWSVKKDVQRDKPKLEFRDMDLQTRLQLLENGDVPPASFRPQKDATIRQYAQPDTLGGSLPVTSFAG